MTWPSRPTRNLVKFQLDRSPGRPPFCPRSQWKTRVRVVAVHVDLGEHREGHAVVALAERRDLVLGAGLLVAELVAGKPSTVKPWSANSSWSAWRPSYCGVRPHSEAVLTTSTTWPSYDDRSTSWPSMPTRGEVPESAHGVQCAGPAQATHGQATMCRWPGPAARSRPGCAWPSRITRTRRSPRSSRISSSSISSTSPQTTYCRPRSGRAPSPAGSARGPRWPPAPAPAQPGRTARSAAP